MGAGTFTNTSPEKGIFVASLGPGLRAKPETQAWQRPHSEILKDVAEMTPDSSMVATNLV